jgi:hypothetical protein
VKVVVFLRVAAPGIAESSREPPIDSPRLEVVGRFVREALAK